MMGHTIVIVPAKGAVTALREGAQVEGGKLDELKTGVIDNADHTWVYTDSPLLEKLKARYPDIEDRQDVLIIRPERLTEWYDAVTTVTLDKLGTLPG